jgi:hypothetical protein
MSIGSIKGLSWDNPLRIRSPEELILWVDELGFLPLFENEIPGFSAEEHTYQAGWWSGDPRQDPWLWRQVLAKSHRVAYGKFFNKKAGFISLSYLPAFVNYRRDGYDFDARYEDGLASRRSLKIMELFSGNEESEYGPSLPTFEVKRMAGFGKEGEKNFDGVLTDLEMKLYLVGCDFRQKKNRKGEDYGWFVQALNTPESIWGYGLVTSLYQEDPKVSFQRIFDRVKEKFPDASDAAIRKVCG